MHQPGLQLERVRARRLRRASALLTVLALVLMASCSSDEGSSPDQTGAGGSQEAPVSDPDGRITVAYNLPATMTGGFTWDPTEVATVIGDDGLYYLVYGRLMRPTADGNLVPDLAESVEITDRNTIEIDLRPGVTYSDGTPFDAAAVKAGLDRTLSSGNTTGVGDTFYDVTAVEVVDQETVRLRLAGGTANNWYDTYMGSWETTIVKPGETDFSAPIGAGPMVVSSYERDKSMALDRNPTYWDVDNILVGGIDLLGVSTTDDTATANSLASGQADMAPITPGQITTFGSEIETSTIDNPNRLMNIQLCKTDGPLSDPDVRSAMSLAIDREAINGAVYSDTSGIAHGLWPDGHRFHDPSIDAATTYDKAEAQRLLAEAGYANGFAFDLYVLAAQQMEDVAQIIQQQLAAVGITMSIVPAPDYVNQFLLSKAPGGGLAGLTGPNRQKLDQWTGDSFTNVCTYNDPSLDALKDQLQGVSDADPKAAEIWHEIEAKVVEEGSLSVVLLFAADIVGFNSEVLGDGSVMPSLRSSPQIVPDPRVAYVKAGS